MMREGGCFHHIVKLHWTSCMGRWVLGLGLHVGLGQCTGERGGSPGQAARGGEA